MIWSCKKGLAMKSFLLTLLVGSFLVGCAAQNGTLEPTVTSSDGVVTSSVSVVLTQEMIDSYKKRAKQ